MPTSKQAPKLCCRVSAALAAQAHAISENDLGAFELASQALADLYEEKQMQRDGR